MAAPETPDHSPGAPHAQVSQADLDYHLVKMIGRGGYGEVWLVRDREGVHRACKVVYRESFDHERPYEREYEGICKFEPVSRGNESQVKILHVGRRDAAGYFYYIMELADDVRNGVSINAATYVPKSLRTEMEKRGRLPAQECIEIGLSLSLALENLHQHGLIHRDIKPANIIFVNGVPKLADIGLVTEADVTVSYVGTGGFIAPEGPSSPQADVYGLGKVLYEICTGKDRLEYPELPANFGELPDRALLLELNAVVAKACEADPKKRYGSARELFADLALLKNGESVRDNRLSNTRRKLALRILAWAAVILAVCAAGILARRMLSKVIVTTFEKAPPPDASRVAEDEAKIRAHYQSTFSSNDKQAAATDLVKQSMRTDDREMQLADLQVAAELAADAGDFSMAMDTCDGMATRFPIDGLAVKTSLLARASEHARGPGKYEELADICLATGFDALAVDDYESGPKLAGLARTSAKKSGDPIRVQEADFLASELNRCAAAFAEIKKAAEILRSNPADAASSVAVGKFLCFVKNDWNTGLLLIEHGTNSALKAIAETEINQTPNTTNAQVALGDAWRNFSDAATGEDKTPTLQRARYWYLKALATAPVSDRGALSQQLDEFIHAAPTEPGEAHISSRFLGSETIDIYSDEIQWRCKRSAPSGRVNQVKLDVLKAGDVVIIKNTGAKRFMPENVDFSSARLIVNHKSKRQPGKATLAIAPDHVRVTLSHSGGTSMGFDVTVVFGGAVK
jgi:serine/threonine protein kinase